MNNNLIEFGESSVEKLKKTNNIRKELQDFIKMNYLYDVQLFDLVYVSKKSPRKYIVVQDSNYYGNDKDYMLVGMCCATSSLTEDQMPRFVYTRQDVGIIDEKSKSAIDGYWSIYTSGMLLHIKTDNYGWDGYMNCKYYEKTIHPYAISVCRKIEKEIPNKAIANDLYIPAINELRAAIENNVIDIDTSNPILSSSLIKNLDEIGIYYIGKDLDTNITYLEDDFIIIPFLNINIENLDIKYL